MSTTLRDHFRVPTLRITRDKCDTKFTLSIIRYNIALKICYPVESQVARKPVRGGGKVTNTVVMPLMLKVSIDNYIPIIFRPTIDAYDAWPTIAA